MSKYLITNDQYATFLNAKSVGRDGKYEGKDLIFDSSTTTAPWGVKWNVSKWVSENDKGNHPVIHVSWDGADEFSRWVGGTLPTEAQWEYTCRAGTKTLYSFGDEATDIDYYAWYSSNTAIRRSTIK